MEDGETQRHRDGQAGGQCREKEKEKKRTLKVEGR